MYRLFRLFTGPRTSGVIRVATFLAVVNLVLTLCLLPSATAQVEEGVKQSGLTLLKELGPELVGEPELVTLNGQRMSVASQVTPLSVAEVMARFESYCQARSGGLAEELERLPPVAKGVPVPEYFRDPSHWLTSKDVTDGGRTGQLACIVRNDSEGLNGLVKRIGAYIDTGDVRKLGDARYVIARRQGEAGPTHVLAMWTEGSFNIPAMFASEGDAPGRDSDALPRPPGSKRVLTAEITGHPYGLRMYDTQHSHAEVLSYYARELKAQGWHEQGLPNEVAPDFELTDHVKAFIKGGVAAIVVTNQTPANLTGVSLIEIGSRGFVSTHSKGDER